MRAGFVAEGRVVAVRGPGIIASIPVVSVGSICEVARDGRSPLLARVVGFEEQRVSLAAFDTLEGVAAGNKITTLASGEFALPAEALIPGGVHDCFGAAFGGTALGCSNELSWREQSLQIGSLWMIRRAPPPALERTPINEQLLTGVSTIDCLVPLGRGQRVGLFAGPGVGKSTLLGMLAAQAAVDVVVVGLIGERGRELGEFLHDCLTTAARKRTTVVVATSDESAARRWLAAETATAIAEYHRAAGRSVLLLLDSLTRVARALREMTLAAGELPVRQGYTASVFSELPVLLERAGTDARGSISAVYTILTQGENEADPLSDELKSLLDGHLVLDQSLALRGLRPALDVTQSISRVAGRVTSADERMQIQKITAALARLKRDRDIELFGGKPDERLRALIAKESELHRHLSQSPGISATVPTVNQIRQMRARLCELVG